MAVVLLLSLACAGALLNSVWTQVPPGHGSGVDLAMEQLASHASVHHHFRFLKSLDKSEIEVKTGRPVCFFFKPVFFFSSEVGKQFTLTAGRFLRVFERCRCLQGLQAHTCFHICSARPSPALYQTSSAPS